MPESRLPEAEGYAEYETLLLDVSRLLARLSHLTGIFGGRAGEFFLLSMAVLRKEPR
jgi:hypothetical protein